MREFRTILVVALLILFPAVSWYYLEKGKDWRMAGVAEIADKTQLSPDTLYTADGDTLSEEQIFGYYIIATDQRKPVSEEVMNALHEQFGEREDLLLLSLSRNASPPEGWIGINCQGKDCGWLREYLVAQENCALIDDSLRLRRTYDLSSEDQRKKLVEHTAILVPLKKRERLELKRDQ
jgi:hypothetical protein